MSKFSSACRIPILTLLISSLLAGANAQTFIGPLCWDGSATGSVRRQATHLVMLSDGSVLISNKGNWTMVENHAETNLLLNIPQRIYNYSPEVLRIFPGGMDWENVNGSEEMKVESNPLLWGTLGNGILEEGEPVPNGQPMDSNLFCASHLLLPNRAGSVVYFGGDEIVETSQGEYGSGASGANHVYMYTPDSSSDKSWARLQSMTKARWYPTSVMLPSGSILTLGGSGGWANEAGTGGFENLPLGQVTGIEMTSIWPGGNYTSFLPWSMDRGNGTPLVVDPPVPVGDEDTPNHWTWGQKFPVNIFYPFLHVMPGSAETAESGLVGIIGPKAMPRTLNPINHSITKERLGDIVGSAESISPIYPSTSCLIDEEAGWQQYIICGGGQAPFESGGIDVATGGKTTARVFLQGVPTDYSESSGGDNLELVPKIWYDSIRTPEAMAPMHVPRRNHNMVPLPNMTFGVFGGNSLGPISFSNPFTSAINADLRPQRCPEIYDPATNTWDIFGSQVVGNVLQADPNSTSSAKVDRPYHSVAALLPSGQVLIAGGESVQGESAINDHQKFEIFNPPYLDISDRPLPNDVIPESRTLFYDQSIGLPVTIAEGREAAYATLINLESRTHSYNFDQKMVKMRTIKNTDGKITGLQMPQNPTIAQPGWYMIFVVDSKGAVSKGLVVRLMEPFSRIPAEYVAITTGEEDWENDVTPGEGMSRSIAALIHGDGFEMPNNEGRAGRLRMIPKNGTIRLTAIFDFPTSVDGTSAKLRLESRASQARFDAPTFKIMHESTLDKYGPSTILTHFERPGTADRLDTHVFNASEAFPRDPKPVRRYRGQKLLPGRYELTIEWNGLGDDDWIEIDELGLGGFQSNPL